MTRLILTDEKGNSVPIAMYDNWFFAGGTWRPENPGYVVGDPDDDENNEWGDIDDRHNPGYVCRVFSTSKPQHKSTLGLVFTLPKFAKKHGSPRRSGTGDLVCGSGITMRCGEIKWTQA